MKWPFAKLNIRQKVVISLAFVALIMSLIAGFSYYLLTEMERKVEFIQRSDDLRNAILEIRRFEKNFFLYDSPSTLEKIEDYIEQSLKLIDRISFKTEGLRGSSYLGRIKNGLMEYRELVRQLKKRYPKKGSDDFSKFQSKLRKTGREVTEIAEELVLYERKRVIDIINHLRTQLVGSLIVVLIGGIFLIPFVAKRIVRPLKVIEKSMLRIAGGDFRPLPVLATYDETQRVVEAFNKMVAELERRQEQLIQARKMSSLGILTSGVAHQLNNPLNNISTSCQILMEDMDSLDPDFVKTMLHNIAQEVNRAREIVRGLLEFSRVREFSLTPVSLKDVVDKTVRLVSSQVPANVEIRVKVPDQLIVEIDSARMQQVFLNLIMNAIDAIGEKDGFVEIEAWKDENARKVFIEVRDTGSGISEDVLEKVFDPFFTTKEVGSGTGLGLSIAYGIVEKHGGRISVRSKVGEGTVFTIELPIDKECQEPGGKGVVP